MADAIIVVDDAPVPDQDSQGAGKVGEVEEKAGEIVAGLAPASSSVVSSVLQVFPVLQLRRDLARLVVVLVLRDISRCSFFN
eukprot:SAG22_NODE_6894_length_797_cov_2.654728_3_plen_82_part_00